MSLNVLLVCTGNICRSPMAERLLIARTRAGSVTSTSAGTYGLVGHAMDNQAAIVTRELGADPDDHVARELSEDLIRDADLVLGATEEHRDAVLRAQPRAMRRTFTLLEFARLGRDLEPVRPSLGAHDQVARIAELAGRRGLVPAPGPGEDNIGDPYGGTLDGMRACGSLAAAAVDDVIRLLGLT